LLQSRFRLILRKAAIGPLLLLGSVEGVSSSWLHVVHTSLRIAIIIQVSVANPNTRPACR
jgi:hypothetical protein